ncbi:MAG TPA: riboflavin synthase [Polyangia bacterium]
MFTGIVRGLGEIVEWAGHGDTRRLVVATELPVANVPLGASMGVNGVCLTVVDRGPGRFAADVGPETLARTTFAERRVGDRVHLEPPLAVGDELGGHMVSGHVDGVGVIAVSRPRGESLDLEIEAPPEIAGLQVPKGSITVDGVSLTVNTVVGARFGVTLIPHTMLVTLLARHPVGTRVNLEADLIAKHVDRLVSHFLRSRGAPS